MKKITFVIGSLGRGGAERVISILANNYAKKGWDTNILLLKEAKCQYELEPSIRVHDFTCEKSSLGAIFFWVKKIRDFIKSEKPDAVVSFVGRINVITAFACLGLGVRLVSSERNDPRADGRSSFELLLCKLAYKFTDLIVFQNEYQKNCFGNIKNSCVIVNPVTNNLPKNTASKKEFVSVGRLMEQKNYPLLINAFTEFSKNNPDYKLYIYGEGILRENLEQLVQELKMQDKIFLPGNFLNVHEKIKDAEIFVQCSQFEGMSNALIEALSMGMVCISSDWAGVREIIDDNKNGLIFPLNDEKVLSELLKKVSDDSKMSEELRKNALEASLRYSQSSVIKEWEKAIESSSE